MDITDLDQEYSGSDEDSGGQQKPMALREYTRQGPLDSGDCLHIGTFGDVIKRLARREGIELDGHRPKGDLKFHALTIQLICIYGPEDSPIAAERSFDLRKYEQYGTLIPMSWDTRISNSLMQRRRLRKRLADPEESNFTSSERYSRKDSG